MAFENMDVLVISGNNVVFNFANEMIFERQKCLECFCATLNTTNDMKIGFISINPRNMLYLCLNAFGNKFEANAATITIICPYILDTESKIRVWQPRNPGPG